MKNIFLGGYYKAVRVGIDLFQILASKNTNI